jgi:hypothetical protein
MQSMTTDKMAFPKGLVSTVVVPERFRTTIEIPERFGEMQNHVGYGGVK